MGLSLSKSQEVEDEVVLDSELTEAKKSDGHGVDRKPRLDEPRLAELLQALRQISKLQEEAANTRIDAREKMREVAIKRREVWIADAAFMKELQSLLLQDKLQAGAMDLINLSADCQSARDGLGPLEQEGIEAEQLWEGALWQLRQAEEELYRHFEHEFQSAQSAQLCSPHASATSSQYESSLEDSNMGPEFHGGNSSFHFDNVGRSSLSSPDQMISPSTSEAAPERITEISDDLTPLGMGRSIWMQRDVEADYQTWDMESGLDDIDERLDIANEKFGAAQSLSSKHLNSIELYPQLITQFSSRRERINNWLQHTALMSRIESRILKNQLELENIETPSNWSQLVIAYWEKDEAANPEIHQRRRSEPVLEAKPMLDGPKQPAVTLKEARSESTIQSDRPATPRTWSPAPSSADYEPSRSLKSQNRGSL
jgi:hypothetical protein